MKKWIIGLFVFFCLMLLYTRLDYLINKELYSYGLVFSINWYFTNQIVYILLYQTAILTLHLYHKNTKLTIFLEAFVVTSTQDLVYFGLWTQGVFPAYEWTWTSYYFLFGVWNTSTQFFASGIMFIGALLLLFEEKLRRRFVK
ncbi:MAG: hypothetical protein NWF01_05890 [Candidatus Bathyarchaeota archaeon]|nr:hypothetical protein [Candidatus Bathyarchaeota archaeon]